MSVCLLFERLSVCVLMCLCVVLFWLCVCVVGGSFADLLACLFV